MIFHVIAPHSSAAKVVSVIGRKCCVIFVFPVAQAQLIIVETSFSFTRGGSYVVLDLTITNRLSSKNNVSYQTHSIQRAFFFYSAVTSAGSLAIRLCFYSALLYFSIHLVQLYLTFKLCVLIKFFKSSELVKCRKFAFLYMLNKSGN